MLTDCCFSVLDGQHHATLCRLACPRRSRHKPSPFFSDTSFSPRLWFLTVQLCTSQWVSLIWGFYFYILSFGCFRFVSYLYCWGSVSFMDLRFTVLHYFCKITSRDLFVSCLFLHPHACKSSRAVPWLLGALFFSPGSASCHLRWPVSKVIHFLQLRLACQKNYLFSVIILFVVFPFASFL